MEGNFKVLINNTSVGMFCVNPYPSQRERGTKTSVSQLLGEHREIAEKFGIPLEVMRRGEPTLKSYIEAYGVKIDGELWFIPS